MSTINERIKKIIDSVFNGNTRSFSLQINENYQTIRNIIGERNSIPSSSILESIISSIECIDATWLLTGKGEMLKSVPRSSGNFLVGDSNKNIHFGHGSQNIHFESEVLPINESDKDVVSALEKKILFLEGELKSRDKEIEGLQKEIIGLQQQLVLKNEMIAFLQERNK